MKNLLIVATVILLNALPILSQNKDCKLPLQCLPPSSCKKTNQSDIVFPCSPRDSNSSDLYLCCSPLPTPVIKNKFNPNDNATDEPFPSSCGIGFSNRISNGENASIGEHPWMALLGYKFPTVDILQFYCGGSLINNRYILTAAHCLQLQGVKLVIVRLGELNIETDIDCYSTESGQKCADPPVDVPVEKLIPHPKYGSSLKYDIALIKMIRKVSFTDYVSPICLPFDLNLNEDSYGNKIFKIAGWGKIRDDSFMGSSILQYAEVIGWNTTKCNNTVPRHLGPIDTSQFCAVGLSGQDSCKGDSGGPLTNITSDHTMIRKNYQIGVVSFGLGSTCGNQGVPSIYTRVEAYLNWIKQVVQD